MCACGRRRGTVGAAVRRHGGNGRTPLKRPFKRTLSPHAAGCLLVALGPLGRARRMSKKDEDGDEHEHAKVGLRVLDEGTSKLSSQGSAVPGGRP